MALQIYNATVVYPTSDKPYDAGYGPSYNVRLKFDDPSAPKTDGDGEGNVYKKADTQEAVYMQSLSKDDRVQVAWNMRDGTGWYEFVIPDGFTPSASKPTSAPTQRAESRGNVAIEWPAPNEEFWHIWSLALDMEKQRMLMALDTAKELMEDVGMDDEPTDTLLRLGVSLYMNATKHAKVGMVIEQPKPEASDQDVELLLMLDTDDLPTSLINAIVSMSAGFYNSTGLKAFLKTYGITSSDIFDQDSALRIAHIAFDYMQMLGDGVDETEAGHAIENKYDLVAF